jgi:DNA segregation ATPase FtsK/SpoIIIE-like protein
MLYLPSGSARVHRLHAPFVTEKEIAAVVEFWKAQATAEYQQQFLEAPKEERESGVGGDSANETTMIRCTKMGAAGARIREGVDFPHSATVARGIWSRGAFDRHDGAGWDCGCGGWPEAAGSIETSGLDHGSGRRNAVEQFSVLRSQ